MNNLVKPTCSRCGWPSVVLLWHQGGWMCRSCVEDIKSEEAVDREAERCGLGDQPDRALAPAGALAHRAADTGHGLHTGLTADEELRMMDHYYDQEIAALDEQRRREREELYHG